MKMKKKTLLVVTDHGKSRLLPGLLLRPLGFTVFECASGQEAIRIFLNEKPACVLVGLRLEDASGLDVLKGIREVPSGCQTQVIAYVSPLDQVEKAGLIAQGFDGVLLQPIKSHDLVKILVL